MAAETNIEWCDSTFNPWIGCTRVSPACDDCYAARSTPARTLGVSWGAGQPRHRTSASNWELPKRWQREAAAFQAQHGRRRRVFCASLADVFDNEVPDAWRMDLFKVIADTPDLDWLLLTKRIGNVPKHLQNDGLAFDIIGRNVWLGITVVNQAEVDRDVPKLLRVPAAVRFLSVEPMLGPISFEGLFASDRVNDGTNTLEALDWVICGGESGTKARPMHPDWARSLRDQCAAAGVPFLFKQHGEWLPTTFCDDEAAMLPVKRTVYIYPDGHYVPLGESINFFTGVEETAWVGKKAAGRLLDGRTHDGFPEARP